LHSISLTSLVNSGTKHFICLFKNLLSIFYLSSSVKLYSSPYNIMLNLSVAKICFLHCHFASNLIEIAPSRGCSSCKYIVLAWR
jgi:hypothetical protein